MNFTFGIVTNGKDYNHLNNCIQSIYIQNIKDYEIIIVGNIDKDKVESKNKINFIDFDGKTKKVLNKVNTNTLFKYIDTLKISKTIKPINLSLFSDYNPKTTTHGLGFKNKEKALYTVDTIKNRPIKYQVNVIATMLGRAKKHPHKTKDMNDAIKVFSKWMSNYKESSKK